MSYVLTSPGFALREKARVEIEKKKLDEALKNDLEAQKQVDLYARLVATYYDNIRRQRAKGD